MKFSTIFTTAVVPLAINAHLLDSSTEVSHKGTPNIPLPPYPKSKFGYKTDNLAVQLWIKSKYEELDGRGILAPHTDVGMNHLFVGAKAHSPILTYSPKTKTLRYQMTADKSQTFDLFGNYLVLSVGVEDAPGQIPVTRDTSNSTTEGIMAFGRFTNKFWVCKDLNDVSNISSEFFQLMYYNVVELPKNHHCLNIELIMRDHQELNRIRYPSRNLISDSDIENKIGALNFKGYDFSNSTLSNSTITKETSAVSISYPRFSSYSNNSGSNIQLNSTWSMGNYSMSAGSYKYTQNGSIFGFVIIFIVFAVIV